MTKPQSKFVILLNGELEPDNRVKHLCDNATIIAADGGIRHAKTLDLSPQYWIGDFDSIHDDYTKHYEFVEKLTFDTQKDVSDGALAIEKAMEMNATTIRLIGALGGERSDHMFAILFEMMRIYQSGIDIMATSGKEEAWPLSHEQREFDLPKGSLFSILPLTDLKGLCIENAHYPLENCDVEFGRTLTISNIALDKLNIKIQSGSAILMAQPHNIENTNQQISGS